MKDLFVLTADADAMAAMTSVLKRHMFIGIRPVAFDVYRHTMRDSGVVKDGHVFVRRYKGKYHKVLLIWDHHGSGFDSLEPRRCIEIVQERLNLVTWQGDSGAVVLVPELEEWLWHNEASLCKRLGISTADLQIWVEEYVKKKNTTVARVKQEQPKELFEYVCIEKARRTISPKDFEEIARVASLVDWQNSDSFRAVVSLLQSWFPGPSY
ncbi:MAG: hypothetical protein AB1815_01935 [Bacillota bacterium]